MKEIKAYIRREVFVPVATAVFKIEGITGLSASDTYGFGRRGPHDSKHKLILGPSDFPSHVKVEVVCTDDRVQDVIEVIEKSAHTGLRGDGKIYVYDVRDAVRIETGERGECAV